MSPIRIISSVAAVAGLIVSSGCAGLPDSPTAPQTTVTVQPSPSDSKVSGDAGDTTEPREPSPTATGAPPSAEPSSAGTPAPAEQPFAVRPGAIDKVRVTASVFPVRRAGQTATVNVLITSDKPQEAFMLNGELSDGNPEVGSRSDWAVDGLRLVDATNKKAYLPATTGDGICACTPDDKILDETNAVWVSVVFAAPPADLTTISVQIPQFGTITDVPLV